MGNDTNEYWGIGGTDGGAGWDWLSTMVDDETWFVSRNEVGYCMCEGEIAMSIYL